jgi:phosphatidylglycerophosphate synthase
MVGPSWKELRTISKVDRGDPLYELIDYLAVFPAWLLIRTRLTANQVSLIWIIGQIPFSLLLATGDYLWMLVGILGFHFMFILDCTDGIIARYRKQFSLNGIYLDYVGHYINNPLLLICLGVGVARSEGRLLFALLGVIAAMSFLFNKAITLNPFWYGNDSQKKQIEKSFSHTLLKNKKGFTRWLFAALRIEYLGNLMFFGILFARADLVLIIYTVFLVLEAGRKMISQLLLNYQAEK